MRTEDSYFVHRCLNGETEAFAFLVDKYRESVFALAYAKLRNFADAEDITQEVFIKAYKNLRNLKRYDSFSIWLHSITSNLCRDWLRSRHYEHKLMEKLSSTEDLSTHYENDDPRIEMIDKALDILPEAYRQVITLYYLGENNCEEIAKMLGVSSPTIRQRLSRARLEIKEEVFAMMSQTFAQKKLSVGFTFRIVEAIKRVKVNPISSKPLPWGLSLATGLIIAVLSIGTHITSHDKIEAMNGLPLPDDAKVQRVGEMPVDVFKFSNISVISNQHLGGNGLGSVVPSLQNAMFMAPNAEGGTWTKKADMPTARFGLSTSVVNGKIYAIGGTIEVNGELVCVSIVEEYDPITNQWAKKSDMPTARQFLSTSTVNGRIYAIGGYRGGDPIERSTVEEYNPTTDKWIKKADIPTPRMFFSTSVVNGKIYAIGGWKLGETIASVEEYDPVLDKWIKLANMPTARRGLTTGVVNDRIYAIGGGNPNAGFNSSSTLEEYNPVANKWIKKTDMPTAGNILCASVVNGKIYVFASIDKANREINPVVKYDPVNDTWVRATDMPTMRGLFSASKVDGKIYVIGGDSNDGILSTVEEYDPETSGKSIDSKGKLPTTWGDTKFAQNK